MSGPHCRRCGEEIRSWQYSREPGVCTDCYVIDDRARFLEIKPKKPAVSVAVTCELGEGRGEE